MIIVKLIESVFQTKNQVEIIATIEDENGKSKLAITNFFLLNSEILPDDEDNLCYYLEDKELTWDLYIPNYDELHTT
jgi:hypothetical protein